jgi:hypothetical protein
MDYWVSQTLWNRVTGDATLGLVVKTATGGQETFYLRGLAKKSEVDEIFKTLRNLVPLLRSIPWLVTYRP